MNAVTTYFTTEDRFAAEALIIQVAAPRTMREPTTDEAIVKAERRINRMLRASFRPVEVYYDRKADVWRMRGTRD